MARETRGDGKIAENPLLSIWAREGGKEGTSLRGYVGPSSDSHVTLYSSVENPTSSIEIARADILQVEDIPEHFKPFGAKVLWVRDNAKATIRHVVEVKSGRLRMKARRPRADDSECNVSPCSTCRSECSVCISSCQYNPPSPPDPDRRKKKQKNKKRKYA